MKINKDQYFRNFIDDPYLYHHSMGKARNFCACGLNATGDGTTPAGSETVKAVVATNITMLGYAKTGLALVGLYVVVMFVYKKWIK
jgi:hypothetical protein